jgi:hypothetical protein
MQSEARINARGWVLVKPEHVPDGADRYLVDQLADGTIILRPVVTVAPAELRARQHPAVQAAEHQVSGGVASGAAEFPEFLV